MSAAAKQILDAALKLDPAERVHVAQMIWESVDDQPAENAEQLWREELVRRRQKIDSGQARFFSIDEVKVEAQKIREVATGPRGSVRSSSPPSRP